MQRILGIDYGRKRVGVAVSDLLGLTAQMLDTLEVESESVLLEKLQSLVAENGVGRIVLGLPKNMNGTPSAMTAEVQAFAGRLRQKTALPVEFIDERLTSQAALRTLHETGKKTKGNKPKLDQISAVLLLQTYLDSHPSTL